MFAVGDIVKTESTSVVARAWSNAHKALWNFGYFDEWRKRPNPPSKLLSDSWSTGFTSESGLLILSVELVIHNNKQAFLYQGLDGPSLQLVWFVESTTDGQPTYWRKIHA